MLTAHGSASAANGVYTLTTAGGEYQTGTAMSTGRIDVSKNFTIGFDVNLGANDAGADGAAIVFHNDPRGANAIGDIGGGFAVGGIQNGLAIELDTYNN
ncbi:lectin-like domain-containing protein, partial [Mycolicibacterium hodleri]